MFRRQLVQRGSNDPALAALSGKFSGGEFGGEFGFGDESDYGADEEFGFGDEDFGFGDDDFGARPRRAPKPTPQAALAAYHAHHAKKHHNNKRVAKLDPNMHATTKVERYTFTLSQDVVLGTATSFTSAAMSGAPDTTFRPQVLTCNTPMPGFAYATSIRMANVNVSVGSGSEDLFNYSAYAWGRSLDMPTLTPANKATLTGTTTTVTPPGFLAAATFTLTVNFKGPSLLAGGSAM
jgi:hypothetical protein